MLGALAAVFLTGAVVVPADDDPADLPTVFIGACFDGQVSLPPGSSGPVSFELLPHDLRRALGQPASARVWRVGGDPDAFLYLLDYPPRARGNRRICGVASKDMDVRAAADKVELRVAGAVYPRRAGSIQWTDPQGYYTALVTTAGAFNVLQVNWLTDKARAKFVATYKSMLP